MPNIVPIVELSRFHFAFVSKHCLHRCKKDLAMRVHGLCAVDMRTLRMSLWLCRGLDESSILARFNSTGKAEVSFDYSIRCDG